jgi:hypothetical protein
MHWPSAWLPACSCALVVAGCGGSDAARLPSSYAGPAVEQADRIGRLLDGRRQCAASSLAVRLQGRTIDAINTGSIPPPLQEDLLGRVNLLVASIPCGAMDRQVRDPAELARALADWLRDHAAES